MTDITYQVEPVSRDEMDELLRDCVCSNCWGMLSFRFVSLGKWLVFCPNCKEKTRGYVSKKYARRAQERSTGEFIEASRNLKDALGLHEHHTPSQSLRELGF